MNPPVRQVILPDSGADLLRQELALAFAAHGLSVVRAHPDALADPAHPHALEHLLQNGPSLFFSVNFQGLGSLKPTLALLAAANSRAAVWCVDNPWNLLAGVRDPLWKTLPLFVTDRSFLEPLKACGAACVLHLPLAACAASFGPDAKREAAFAAPEDLAPVVFVGRSTFPGKESFFAGVEVAPSLLAEARDVLETGERADLSWWEKRLACDPRFFWPGKKARWPALGAEESGLHWRKRCIAEAAKAGCALALGSGPGLDIFGDEGWRAMLPEGARLRPPVDYYARLPGIYAKARYSLACTSMQLPGGLNQRHFDIWMTGGFCLSDATPGLDVFPEELARSICFAAPKDMHGVIERLEAHPALRAQLGHDWRCCILAEHTYAHRVRAILEELR